MVEITHLQDGGQDRRSGAAAQGEEAPPRSPPAARVVRHVQVSGVSGIDELGRLALERRARLCKNANTHVATLCNPRDGAGPLCPQATHRRR